MSSREPFLAITNCTGGLNTGPVLTVPEGQVALAENIDWHESSVARKRNGVTAVSSPSTVGGAVVTYLSSAAYGDGDPIEASLIAIDNNGEFYDKQAGSASSWTNTTKVDAGAGGLGAFAVSFNGKWYVAYNSAVDRLHVLCSRNGVEKVYRTGLATPAAPTAADAGSGTYSTKRYYQVCWTMQTTGVTLLRSDFSPALAHTPDGSHASVTVTRPTAPSEGETHWELYGSADGLSYYLLSTIVIGTTTYSDSAAPSSYSSGTVAEDAGTYAPLVSAKVLGVDENRLLLGGSWEDATLASRVWWTPVIGADGVGDDERTVNTTDVKNYLDLDPYVGGGVTAISGPILGNPYVWKERRMYKFVRTGDVSAPYLPVVISRSVGCVRQHTVVHAETADGEPAVYWLAQEGPYCASADGVKWLGEPIRDVCRWLSYPWAHGLYYADRHQVWWWVYRSVTESQRASSLSGSGYANNLVLVYDIRRQSWTTYTDYLSQAVTSAMHGRDSTVHTGQTFPWRVPHIALASLGHCESGTTDLGYPYRARLTTRPFLPQGWMTDIGVTEVEVLGTGRVQVGLVRDLDAETRNETVTLTPEGEAESTWAKVEGLALSSAKMVQVQLEDEIDTEDTWQVEAVVLRTRQEGVR